MAEFRVASRQSWQAGANNESQARFSADGLEFRKQALGQYQVAIGHLQQTRDAQGTQVVASTSVPLAKSHLDAARVLVLLNRGPEAQSEVHSAELLLQGLLLHPPADKPLSNGWLWRIYYLLGDVNLYQQNNAIARHYFEQANGLNPDFVPASAMVQYLGGAVTAPVPPPADATAAGTDQSPQAVGPRVIQTAGPASMSAPQTAQLPPRVAPNTGTPVATAVIAKAQPQDTSSALYQEMKKISVSKAIPMAAQAVTLIASVLEVTELAPVAAAITLAGMIVDYAVKQ